MRTDKAVDRNYTPNPAWDAGGAGVIQFGVYTKAVPDMASSRPPRYVAAKHGEHTLERSMFGGAYYDVCDGSLWYLGKYPSARAAVVAWHTRLRQIGVM